MKLLILADIPAPYRVAVFKGLAEEYDIDVFFNSPKNAHRNLNWYIHPDRELNFYVMGTDETQRRYEDCLRRIKEYDAVLCYDPWAKRSRALQRLCRRKHIPYALNADGALGITMRFPRKQVKTYYAKRAPLCFAGCHRAVEYFKAYGAKDDSIVQHPFTSLHRDQIIEAPYTPQQKAAFKSELGMEDRPTFIAVGQFIHRKGFDLLLTAWGKTSQEGQLYIIGGGPLRAEYDRLIGESGLRNVYVEDFKQPDELKRYYRAADVFVMPTREDIWGLVVNEAMAEGLPVLSSDRCTSGLELIENGKNGYVYSCEDTDALGDYISQLAAQPRQWQAFSENTLQIIREYTLENVVNSHLDSLKKLLSK